mmetsp:Transcript_50305/g.90401  ORF Transcript_50305/g.90401 Transcript_50305/m.90401 type:complete len:200 (-) Transcript_50305:1206-1805(-)
MNNLGVHMLQALLHPRRSSLVGQRVMPLMRGQPEVHLPDLLLLGPRSRQLLSSLRCTTKLAASGLLALEAQGVPDRCTAQRLAKPRQHRLRQVRTAAPMMRVTRPGRRQAVVIQPGLDLLRGCRTKLPWRTWQTRLLQEPWRASASRSQTRMSLSLLRPLEFRMAILRSRLTLINMAPTLPGCRARSLLQASLWPQMVT